MQADTTISGGPAPENTRERALIVDDDPVLLDVCRRALGPLGLEVSTAGNGAEARRLLAASSFDLVLTDVHMAAPGEGVLLTEEIKSHSPDTCVVVMTGAPSLDTAIPSLKHGAADYLNKPFEPGQLEAVARRCLERRRLSLELRQEKAARRELEAAYAQLQKAEEAKEAVLARISHELRTPLAIAMMASDLVNRELPDGDGKSMMAKLTAALTGLQGIIEEVLLYAKLGREQLVLRREDVDLPGLLGALVERHRPLWSERGLAVEVVVEGRARPANGDAALLETAFRHLLLNAIRFNERGGAVTLRCRFGEDVAVLVEDTGIGVPADRLTNVFDSFYQVASFWTREHGGLGLGLATVRRIVEAHRGSVSAARRAPRGMIFVVSLPQARP